MRKFLEIAMIFKTMFGFNVLPMNGKQPIIDWENWQLIEQTNTDVQEMNWVNNVSGISDYRNIDFDKVNDPMVVEQFLKRLGLTEKYAWTVKSGSGNGFHVWIKVSESEELYKRLNGKKSVYRLHLKESGLCDHIELRWNNSITVLPYSKHPSGSTYAFYYDEPKEPPLEVSSDILIECLEDLCELEKEREILAVGKRTFEPTSFDMEKLESAIEFLGNSLPNSTYDEWYRIGFALATIGEEGRKYFLKMSLSNPHYHDTEFAINKKFDELQKDYDGKITLGTLYHIAEKYGWVKPFVKFWYVDNEKVRISKPNFKRFLEENGFCKLKLEKGYIMLRVQKNIVHEVEIFNIKDFVINHLKGLDGGHYTDVKKSRVIDEVMKGASQHFVLPFLEFLETKELNFLRDTKEKGYLFFSNCFVEITKSKITSKRYEELEGFIWDKQVIRKCFVVSKKESEFGKFISNICKSEAARIDSMRSALGYLLHNYKDSTNAKAVIFLDERIMDGAYGRSGKGVVSKAIGKLRKSIRLDGRNFTFAKNFVFQSVTLDTAIIEFNDVTKKFNFDKLFSIITDDITVEKKNQNEIIIPFHESPKVLISTNYTIDGSDDSTLDRQFVIEFSDHYNIKHTPITEFGHRFFDEWSNEDWINFFNYMVGCFQIYLQKGLIQYNHINLERKKLINSTSEEFADYFETIELGKEHLKKDLFENFRKEYDEYADMQAVRFAKWIKDAAKIKGIKINSFFFSLERKEAKVQGCKSWLRISLEILWKLNSSRIILQLRDFKQQFPFNAFLIHSLYAKDLMPMTAMSLIIKHNIIL